MAADACANNFNLWTFLTVLLGSGLGVTLLEIFFKAKSEKRSLEREYLNEQILNLYGPLFFMTSQNEDLFEVNKKFIEAYKEEYESKNFSDDEQTSKALKQKTGETLDLSNGYIDLVVKNNKEVMAILKNNYAYIDIDDHDIFAEFGVHYSRLNIEIEPSGRLRTPREIYKLVGGISFMPSEFISRVKNKFKIKKKQLGFSNR